MILILLFLLHKANFSLSVSKI